MVNINLSQNISNYVLTASTPAYTNISGGISSGLSGMDDSELGAGIPIGFDFWFMGSKYTHFNITTNGTLELGGNSSIASSGTLYNYVNGLETEATADVPLFAPLWDDLKITAGGDFIHKTSGTATNRKLELEWKEMEWNTGAGTDQISYMVVLFESTGVIEFHYKQGADPTPVGASASVGIRSALGDNGYICLTDLTGTPGTSEISDIATLSSLPADNQKYIFTPPVPNGNPSGLSFPSETSSSIDILWSDNATNEVKYLVYVSGDNINFSLDQELAANSTSATVNGLAPSTLYYFKIYAITEGAFSNAVSGNHSTLACSGGLTTLTWDGGGDGIDWHDPLNWDLDVIPVCNHDVVINITSDKTISLSSGSSINSLTFSVSGANDNGVLDVGANRLTIAANTTVSINSGNGNTSIEVNLGEGGEIIYGGDFTCSASSGNAYPYGFTGGDGLNTGVVTHKGNVTYSDANVEVSQPHIPSVVIFDGTGTQTVTNNCGANVILLGLDSTVIGRLNSPQVILAGSGTALKPNRDLHVNNGCTLNLATKTFNPLQTSNTLILESGSFLMLEAGSGGETGSNFPTNFSTFIFDKTSTVNYSGKDGTNQTIFSNPIYGNLKISAGSGSSTKTAGGSLDINGNLHIASSTLNGASFSHNLEGNFIRSGGFTASTSTIIFDNLTAGQTISASAFGNRPAFYNLTIANNGNTITLLKPIRITNSLNFATNGYLNINGETLTLENWSDGTTFSETTTADDRFIILSGNSEMRITDIDNAEKAVFHVGGSSANTEFCRVDLTNNSGVSKLYSLKSCKYLNDIGTCFGGTAESDDAINRTWTLGSATDHSYTVDVFYHDVAGNHVSGNAFDNSNSTVNVYNGSCWESGTFGASTLEGSTIYKTNLNFNTYGPLAVSSLESIGDPFGSINTYTAIQTAVMATDVNKEMLRVEVIVCENKPVTSITFNTTGSTSPSNDINNAKLYFTGASSTFATSTQLGASFNNPNGTFIINGFSQNLSQGTNYFWLAYDISSGATLGNVVDAECTSVIYNGSNKTPSTTAPSGSREIDLAMTYVSSRTTQNNTKITCATLNRQEIIGIEIVTSGAANPMELNSVTCNTNGSSNPTTDVSNGKLWYTGNSSVFGTTTQWGTTVVSPNGSFVFSAIDQLLIKDTNYLWVSYDIPSGGVMDNVVDAECNSLTIDAIGQTPSVTAPSGNRTLGDRWIGTTDSDWGTSTNWSSGLSPANTRHAYIPSGTPNNPVIAPTTAAECLDLYVASGVTLTVNCQTSGPARTLDVYGNITNDGTIIRNDNKIQILGNDQKHYLGGTGSWTNDGDNLVDIDFTQGTTVLTSNFTIDNAQLVTDSLDLNGKTIELTYSFTIGGPRPLIANGGTVWINSPLASLNIVDFTYYNLKLSPPSGITYIFGNAITNVFNDMEITSVGSIQQNVEVVVGRDLIIGAGTLNSNSQNLSVSRDFINNGTYTSGTGLITFSGATSQNISGSGAITFNDVTMNNPTEDLTLNSPVTVNGILTFTDGDIISSASNKLTLNTGASISGASVNSKIVGPVDVMTASAVYTEVPVGTAALLRPLGFTPASTTAETYTVEYVNSSPPNPNVICTGETFDHAGEAYYWDFTRSGSVDASIRLHWDASAGVDEANIADLNIVRHSNSCSGNPAWEETTGSPFTTNTTNDYIETTGNIGTFGKYTFGSTTTNHTLGTLVLFWFSDAGNWNDGAHWSTNSGGPTCSCTPTINDHVRFDANSFSSTVEAVRTVTVPSGAFVTKSMKFLDNTKTPYIKGSGSLVVGQ